MEFFDKVFNWIEQLSAKVGSFDIEAYFFIVLGIILAVGIIIGLTFLDSTKYKLLKASKRIIAYLKTVENVDDDNVAEFTERCFSDSVPKALRDSWVEFLGVRFGYPSEIMSQQNVYDKEVRRADNIRPAIFLTISLILVGLFAFFGYGGLDKTGMSVILTLGWILVAVIFIILVVISKSLNKQSLNKFYEMQEDIDAKVNLPIETNYSTDGSPLNEAASIIDEIIAKNLSKEVDSDYQEVKADMGNEIVLNPVVGNYALKKEQVYVQPEFDSKKIVPSVPKVKRKLFKGKTQKKPEVNKEIIQQEPVQIVQKVEEQPKENVTVEKTVIENLAVEKPIVNEPVMETPIQDSPDMVASTFDFDNDEVIMPVKTETPVTVAPVEELKQEEKVEEIKEVENKQPVKVENVVEQKPIQVEQPVEEEFEEEVIPIPEIHLQTISNEAAPQPKVVEKEEKPNIAVGKTSRIMEAMTTDAFGGSVLAPFTEEEKEKRAKKKARKEKREAEKAAREQKEQHLNDEK